MAHNIKTYDKIFSLGNVENADIFRDENDIIVIEEKVDGACMRIKLQVDENKESKLIFGSRTQNLVEGQINKNFKRSVDFVNSNFVQLSTVEKEILEGYVFFCENMIKHTMSYNWDITPPLIGYDVYSEKEFRYLNVDEIKPLFEILKIEFIPVIKSCSAKECLELIKNVEELEAFVPTSKYVTMKAEGIVFKNNSKQIMAKFVRKEFKEKNSEVFGGTKKKAPNDEEWMTVVYSNNYKIEKMILKLLDEGEPLSLELMHKLPVRVFTDIFEENWREIIKLDKTINFRRFKSSVSKRCIEVLNRFMINRIQNERIQNEKSLGQSPGVQS